MDREELLFLPAVLCGKIAVIYDIDGYSWYGRLFISIFFIPIIIVTLCWLPLGFILQYIDWIIRG